MSDPTENILQIRMCKCGRAPHRKGQRNCHFCHKEANKKYRRSIRELVERVKHTTDGVA